MGVWVSSSHVVSAAPSSSGREGLTRFPLSSVGSVPRETVLHELLQRVLPMGYSSSRTAPAWVPCMGCSPSGADCSSVGPPRGHKPCQQTCFGVGSSLHRATGPQVLPGACSSAGFPRGHSVLRASTCSGVGSSTGCRWISAPPRTSMGCRGTACRTMVFTTGCRGISLCSGAWSTSSPSFFTDLGVCRVVPLTSSHASLWLQLLLPCNFFSLS